MTGDTLGRHYAGNGPHNIMSGVGFETKPPLEAYVKGSCISVGWEIGIPFWLKLHEQF